MSEQVVAEDLEARSKVQVTQKSIDGRSLKPVQIEKLLGLGKLTFFREGKKASGAKCEGGCEWSEHEEGAAW